MKIIKKSVLKNFVILDDGTEFLYSDLISTIYKILDTSENDITGDYSLRNYEIDCLEVIEYFVNKGYVKKYIGSKQAILYCAKNKEKLQEFLDKIETLSIEKDEKSINFIKKSELIDLLMENYNSRWSFHDLLENISKLEIY